MENTQTKVALITGAAQRIGAVIAALLHENGMNVVIHYRDSKQAAEALCTQLNQARPDSAITLQSDLNVTQTFPDLINKAQQHWGRLDALVNNASSFYPTPLGTMTEDNWEDLMASNVKAPLFLSQLAAPFLKIQQGCIINITDIHAQRPLKNYTIYCIAKAGLVMLTKSLAKELGPDIRVNAVAPGAILWPSEGNEVSDDIAQKILQSTCLKRQGTPEDIAKTVLFLIKDAAYITGQIIAVDGGRMLGE